MNREEYLRRLSYLLQDLPEEEYKDALEYYEDYFEEAGPDREQEVIRELGRPERIAAMIRDSVKEKTVIGNIRKTDITTNDMMTIIRCRGRQRKDERRERKRILAYEGLTKPQYYPAGYYSGSGQRRCYSGGIGSCAWNWRRRSWLSRRNPWNRCCCLCFLYWTADRRNCGCHFRNCENVYCGADRNAPSWLRMSYGSSRTASPYAGSLDHWGSALN